MRTLFDQYVHPENRLTHAFVSCLAQDASLLADFLRRAGVTPPRGERLYIVEQRLPGELEEQPEDVEPVRRLPDAWIYTDSGWAFLIESKIAAPVDLDQLRDHITMAERRGFSDVRLVLLSCDRVARKLPARCSAIGWRDVYTWACEQAKRNPWAAHLTHYMPVAEQRMVDDGYLLEGTLTTFTGIPFGPDHPYNYVEAKRQLRLLMDEIRADKSLDELGINRAGAGRKKITGSMQDSVWDILPLKIASADDAFTRFPHFTASIQHNRVLAIVTLPDGLEPRRRRQFSRGGYAAFGAAIEAFLESCKSLLKSDSGAEPIAVAVQRHYPSRSAPAVRDALLEFDPRTASGTHQQIKHQNAWLRTYFEVYETKQANTQLSVGVAFPFGKSTCVATAAFPKAVCAAWRATAPILDRILEIPPE